MDPSRLLGRVSLGLRYGAHACRVELGGCGFGADRIAEASGPKAHWQASGLGRPCGA